MAPDTATLAHFAQEHYDRGFAEGRARGRTAGLTEGRAAGLAAALMTALDARHIDLPDDLRARISACTDPLQLHAWLTRVLAIPVLDEVFRG
ncbi:hypothetical protein ABZW11_35820 [Nonomuraea sp. NPDC004580]|uniref:hypothetical protein n=1 Tax=Nonomuraea sp. NPDC004580 TaxID=3154552 RepID=UPI0033B09AAB